jgi:hypothetical protein
MVFLGAVIAIAGLAFAAFLHVRANETWPDENFAQDIRNKQPYETWELWYQFMRHGIAWRPQSGPQRERDLKAYEELKRWEWISFGLAGAGLVVIVLGFTLVTKRSGAPKRSPPRTAASAKSK